MPGARNVTLLYRFELTVDDVKYRVSTTPGDVRRARKAVAAEGLPSLDELMSSDTPGGAAMEFILIMAWLAMRHEDGFEAVDLDQFGDRVTEVVVLSEGTGDRLRPTDAGPTNE
jgi:hypothetical protein